jgi:hypothetical protein
MVSFVRRSRGGARYRLCAAVALTLYAVLLAAGPVLCHDLACHMKSAPHCDACVAHPVASSVESRVLDIPPLPAAGETPRDDEQRELQRGAARTSGRSPPA